MKTPGLLSRTNWMLWGGRSSQTIALPVNQVRLQCFNVSRCWLPSVVTTGVVPFTIDHSHARFLPQATSWSEPVRLGQTLGSWPIRDEYCLSQPIREEYFLCQPIRDEYLPVLAHSLTPITLTPSLLSPTVLLVGSIWTRVEAQNQPLILRGW